jgi:hypothetical protein
LPRHANGPWVTTVRRHHLSALDLKSTSNQMATLRDCHDVVSRTDFDEKEETGRHCDEKMSLTPTPTRSAEYGNTTF